MEEPSTVRTQVRLPADLHRRIVQLAERDLRSLNAEMVWLLRRAVDTEPERQETPG